MDAFIPLFKRLDQVTGTMLLPALADGQVGFVIDAKWTSKQWIKAIPPTEKALPLPEFGIVLGVSNAEQLRKAMTDYRETLLVPSAWCVMHPDWKPGGT